MFGDYPYCSGWESSYTDEDGGWNIVNDNWCKVNDNKCNNVCQPVNGYPCCENSSTKIEYVDDDGNWGVENDNWCIIKN